MGILVMRDSSWIVIQFCNSSSSRRGNSAPCNARGGGRGGPFEAGRFPSGLFPRLVIILKSYPQFTFVHTVR